MESAVRIGCMANRYARIAMLHYADAKMQAETIYHTADYDEMSILEDKLYVSSNRWHFFFFF